MSIISSSRIVTLGLCVAAAIFGVYGAPATSSGSLMDAFNQIYEATGTFPDDKDEYTQFAIVNQHFNACLAVLGRKVGNGGRVGLEGCYFSNVESPELFWLRHAGNGYVVLGTPWNKCLGSGKQHGSPVWTGDWCDSPSHQFWLELRGEALLFVHRDSGHYLTAVDVKDQVRTAQYAPFADDQQISTQHWQVCEPSGRRCWPQPKPVVVVATKAPTAPPLAVQAVDESGRKEKNLFPVREIEAEQIEPNSVVEEDQDIGQEDSHRVEWSMDVPVN